MNQKPSRIKSIAGKEAVMNQKPSRIKSIVEAAIRMLNEDGWNPSHGGVWQSNHVNLRVEFYKPTRFCVKASYRVIGEDVGLWAGYLNGASHKNVGKPNQIYTPEELAEELELSSTPLQSIVASGLNMGG